MKLIAKASLRIQKLAEVVFEAFQIGGITKELSI